MALVAFESSKFFFFCFFFFFLLYHLKEVCITWINSQHSTCAIKELKQNSAKLVYFKCQFPNITSRELSDPFLPYQLVCKFTHCDRTSNTLSDSIGLINQNNSDMFIPQWIVNVWSKKNICYLACVLEGGWGGGGGDETCMEKGKSGKRKRECGSKKQLGALLSLQV